ncbi:hypothetical protein QU487_06605 [Crenobacter sp. SG2305]|uniref:hypothetical protein n=1 Tax=Crenobacter oryzisoli TaxID=3056844 RepID=UPI0025AA5C35|nr:hypothetical protein [Crenobacter sp. SG2305]MDN0082424.1 hypothetical protein [Crenobacter sp. SG2305]
MQTPLERLAERLNQAVRLLGDGGVTLTDAIELVRPFLHVTVLPTDLFPADLATDQSLRGLLAMMELLDGALFRYRRIGVVPSTRLRDIPLLTAGIRAAAEAARSGKPGQITFT